MADEQRAELAKPNENPHNIEADKYYIFNQTGNIMFASTEEMDGEVPAEVRDLFAEVSVFFAAMTKAITSTPNPDDGGKPYSIYNYTALRKIINRSGLFVHVTQTDYLHTSNSFGIQFSKELLEGLLGLATGAGALSFAQGMLASIGKEGLKIGKSDDRVDDEVANIVFVCEYLLGMPSISAIVVYCKTSENKDVFEFGPCIKTESSSFEMKMHKDTYLFVTPEFVRKYSADLASVASNADYNEFVEYLESLLTDQPHVSGVYVGDTDQKVDKKLDSGGNYRITGANLQNVVKVRRRDGPEVVESTTRGQYFVKFMVKSDAVKAGDPDLDAAPLELVDENDLVLASTEAFKIGPEVPLLEQEEGSDGRSTPVAHGPLGFTAGKNVSARELKRFISEVDAKAAAVSKGIVAEIKKKKIPATVTKKGDIYHIDCVEGGSDMPTLGSDQIAVYVDPKVDITITARTEDAPAIIDALDRFFGNWRAVAGLIATGAAVMGGMWLLRVDPAEAPPPK